MCLLIYILISFVVLVCCNVLLSLAVSEKLLTLHKVDIRCFSFATAAFWPFSIPAWLVYVAVRLGFLAADYITAKLKDKRK